MITIEQYFGRKPHTPEQTDAAVALLYAVEFLLQQAEAAGFERKVDPDTGTEISGSKGGPGDGGFRAPDSTTGSPRSAHREARAVDVYDPDNDLDLWLTDEILREHGLYREAPAATPGWCHLQTRRPGSGNRTFQP